MKTSRQRWLPSPLLSVVLFLVWPVLNQSWSLGQLLLGLCLAVVIPWFTEPLRDHKPTLRRPWLAARVRDQVGQGVAGPVAVLPGAAGLVF